MKKNHRHIEALKIDLPRQTFGPFAGLRMRLEVVQRKFRLMTVGVQLVKRCLFYTFFVAPSALMKV